MSCKNAATSSNLDLENCAVEIAPRQGFVVPKGVMHRTRAQRRTVIIMVQTLQSYRQENDHCS